MARGIYVAFDQGGRHFAYAKHPDDCPEHHADQEAEVERMRGSAKVRGGSVRLLSPEEFKREIARVDPPANDNLDWYVVMGSASRADQLRDFLERDGYQVYCPLMREMKLPDRSKLSKKQRKNIRQYARPVVTALFPGYLFVRFNPLVNRWHEIFRLCHLRGLVINEDRPKIIDDAVIERLRSLEDGGAIPIDTKASTIAFALGEQVRIGYGAFAGFNGSIQELDESRRLVILEASLFGRPTPIEMSLDEIEKL
jgi:transcription antitermination factor NusG